MIVAPELTPAARAALPTFFIIGAPKAGTTSLHEYLAEHPEIAMTADKEPSCFETRKWAERLDDYVTQFRAPARERGESSTAYSSFPWQPEIPDRIRATVPEARFIYLLREPIPRMLSHYAQNLWDGKPVRPFDELMEDLEDPWNMPVWCSRYATQLERWIERFGRDRVLVLDQRDLLQDRARTLRRVFEFLEVDASFTSPAWDALHNTARSHRVPTPLAHRLRLAGRHLGPLTPLLTRAIPLPSLTAEQRSRVEALLAPEVARVRELTGLALDHWGL